jgi:hypothetical protein
MSYENIRLVKLITGDMVLGKIDENQGKIQDPAVLQTVPTQQGVQMMLLPFGYPFENEIGGEIEMRHVIYEYKNFPEELKSKYMEASSNLTISSQADLKNLNLGGGGGAGAGGGGGNVSDMSQLFKK